MSETSTPTQNSNANGMEPLTPISNANIFQQQNNLDFQQHSLNQPQSISLGMKLANLHAERQNSQNEFAQNVMSLFNDGVTYMVESDAIQMARQEEILSKLLAQESKNNELRVRLQELKNQIKALYNVTMD